LKNVVQSGEGIGKYQDADWQKPLAVGDYVHALVVDIGLQFCKIKLGRSYASLGPAELAWTGHKLPKNILVVGDIVYVKVLALYPDGSAKVSLEQDSGAQGALLAIDNTTGDIKAMVGGRDYDASKFNRATQASRQAGSSFKPFVYTAAIDQGAEPDDLIMDAPTTFNSAGVPYSPRNFDRKFEGNITLRHAMAESRNIPAVKLAQRVGMPTVADYARRFGITSPILPFLPVALGAADVTLYEQTSAYTVFPNDGLRIEPRYIRKVTDYEGHVLEQDFPDAKDVVGQHTARTMVSLLEEVVKHGTASSAKKLNHPVAGKTGTTNDYTDAWFVGFTPSLTCGVWVGFDEKKNLGESETGGHAALPIWLDFMRVVVADPARKDEAFAAVSGDKKKATAIKRASITPPRQAGDAEAH
jgi:penicillin-binding protein 1A